MARAHCLADIALQDIPTLTAAIRAAVAHAELTITPLDVPMLVAMAPVMLVADIDARHSEGLEALKQLRFVMPDCSIAVFTDGARPRFARDAHNAGANCVLSKASGVRELTDGLRRAWETGCFTDPRFSSSEAPPVA